MFGEPDGRPETRAAGTNHHCVVLVVDDGVARVTCVQQPGNAGVRRGVSDRRGGDASQPPDGDKTRFFCGG